MERKGKEIERDVIREDVLEKMKEEYYQEDVVMSEFLRGQDDLSVAEKRELLRYSGDDEYMAVLENGEIESLEDIYEEIVTGLNEVVEAIGYDVESNGFGYSEDVLAALDEGVLVGFYEGFLWLKDELENLEKDEEGILNGLHVVSKGLGLNVEQEKWKPISKQMDFLLEKMVEMGLSGVHAEEEKQTTYSELGEKIKEAKDRVSVGTPERRGLEKELDRG